MSEKLTETAAARVCRSVGARSEGGDRASAATGGGPGRGEPEIRVPPPELERWRRRFLEGAREGLKAKNAPDGALMRTRAKLGEMTMRVELQGELLEKRGYGDELRKLLRRAGG